VTEESTTPDPVELGQRAVNAVNARDVDALMSFYGPDAVYDMPETFGLFEGCAAIRGFVEDWLGSYDETKLEPEEMCDLGAGVGFYVVVMRGRPRGSGGWVQFRYGSVLTWIDALCERHTDYPDIDQARAAAERLAQERG
jgi:ketosteroid isomerase-like protein